MFKRLIVNLIFFGLIPSIGSYVSMLAQSRIPIMASHTIRANYNSLYNYKTIEEGGFTLARENYPSRDVAIQHLKTASKTNVKLIIWCPDILDEETIRQFNRHKSFGGYSLHDEPGVNAFEELSIKIKHLESLDKKHYIWTNLFPIHASKQQLQSDSYEHYVKDYIEKVNPPFVSFDCYGILKSGLRTNYFQNLEIVSNLSRENNIPFWAYVLTSQFGSYERPTKGTLSFQAYNNLAYGAQGIEYFSYRRILDYGLNMSMAPIDIDYKKMEIFDAVKELNAEIAFYSRYFCGNHVQDISHLCKELPLGTHRLEHLPVGLSIKSYSGEGFVVSQFTNKHRKYVLFVNRDYKNSQKLTIESSRSIRHISCKHREKRNNKDEMVFTVEPGSIVLLRVE